MSFGGGFGGFGQNNNNNQPQNNAFGGFGTNTNTTTGFGATNNTGFGATNNTTGGGLFGSGGSSGFGATGGAFGNNNAFGAAKPSGFGTTATTGASLFGGGTATTGTSAFGGFGATNNTTATSGFGSNNNTGGLFGGNKTAFGTPAATNTGFGGGPTSAPFGATTTSAFGTPASTALGGVTADCPGTGSVPFQAFVEKEPNSSTNQQNAFQSICFQQPYQKFSPEELRLADYNQGRRYGNASNQAGAFGQTNFGGGFGANNNTGFGATNNNTATSSLFGGGAATTPFGTSQPAATAFGANTTTGGGLFGAAKPANTLFGAQPAAQTTGGLFGNSGGTGFGTSATGGFGAANNTGSSLFGNNTAAAKPASAFSFGTSQPAAATGTGFGAPAATNGGFGGGLFGNNNQQNNTTAFGAQPATNNAFGGGFGNNNNNQQQTGGSLFGNPNAQKPATGGLFGAPAANTGGGLFGSTPAATNPSPFGAANSATNTGGLFGNKPAATGGLFGSTNNQTNTNGSNLFSGFGGSTQNQPQQQNNSGGLFGSSLSNNNQQKPSMFGTPQQQNTGGLFGNSGNQQQPQNSPFGGLNNNNQQAQQQQGQNSLFGSNSLFGNSQQGQQNQSLTASINDPNALGGGSFFSSLGANPVQNLGPLATPLSSNAKAKKTAALPMYKLNSASASRFSTPQKQRGFGFSYSTYGSPNSASSTASTPGAFGGSLLGVGSGNTFGRTLNKSMSTSSLRRSFSTEDSILAPGAFSASPNTRHFGSTGSVKRLTISRNIRQDLFSPPNPQAQPTPSGPIGGILKKRVSFDANTNGNLNGASSPLKQMNNAASSNGENTGFSRQPSNGNSSATYNNSSVPEMEQVSNPNNQLAVVREEEPAPAVQQNQSKTPVTQEDKEPGEYWMQPSRQEIENMSRSQRQAVRGLTVGRRNIGQVVFDAPVDLTKINLDDIMGKLVVFEIRVCTVYPNGIQKPAMGQGLNVPSTISLENSWPRKGGKNGPAKAGKDGASGPLFKKHVERLKKVTDTHFVNYEADTGVWTFAVPHFTTYGFPEDDEEDEDEFGQSTMSLPPNTPTPKTRRTPQTVEESFVSTSQVTESEADDTFEFRRKKILPGAFDEQPLYDDEDEAEPYSDEEQNYVNKNGEISFLDERSVGSQSEDGVEEPMDQDDVFQDDESVSVADQEMVGSYPDAGATELDEGYSRSDGSGMDIVAAETPGAVMRAGLRALESGTPTKQIFAIGDDWANTLQATVSPKKQDRAFLKSLIDLHGNETRPDSEPTPTGKRDAKGFVTGIDLMNSLFGPGRSPAKVTATSKGFKWPYSKRSKTGDYDVANLSSLDRAWHDSMKPSWGPQGTLVYTAFSDLGVFGQSHMPSLQKDGLLNVQKGAVVSESRDIRFAKFSHEAAADLLKKHKDLAVIDDSGAAPFAHLQRGEFSFSDFAAEINARDPATAHEKTVWQLASILFDPILIPNELQHVEDISVRLRKDQLSSFWRKLVDDASSKHAAMARSNEEKAIACLSGHNVADACAQLINSGNFHLATLVALIGSKDSMRKDMRTQLNDWQKSGMLSEFSEPIRAIYELLSGNVCVCSGSKGPEDRMESFVLSKRFGLDWRQSFGLRLWYGISSNDSFKPAVDMFHEALEDDKETARPHAWYVEQKVPTLWEDKDISIREDLLWVLLKLYAFEDVDLQHALRPENSQLSPLNFRLAWQLQQTLADSGVIQSANGNTDTLDRTTISFAAQLTSEGSWMDAIFVLLHLTKESARVIAIQNHLAHHAGFVGVEDSQTFTTLTQRFKIPTAWIWEAKALYMRSVQKNPRAEVECLVKAGSFNEAHSTFAREVAPRAIVEMDHDVLRTLLKGFKGKETRILEWHLGGEIYEDYLHVLEYNKRGGIINHIILQRLLAGLPAVVEESRHPSFMQTVAIETMSGVVAKTVIALGKNGEKSNLSKVLRLPLTEDKYLKHTIELSLEYFKTVIASAR